MRRLATLFSIALLLTVGAPFAHAAAILGLPDAPKGFVTDTANLLTSDEHDALETNLNAFRASTSIEIAVVTVPSLQNDYIENVTVKLFQQWGIGNKDKDTGVLFLIAKDEHQARIEVGYGLEGALTDSKASAILSNDAFPAFKADKYGEGIIASVNSIKKVTQGEALPYSETSLPTKDYSNLATAGLFLAFIFFQIITSILRKSKSWWLGGVMGGVIGVIVTFFGILGITLGLGILLTIFLTVVGLIVDFVVSKNPNGGGRGGWGGPFIGGFGGGSGSGGGGFGGFSGGSSGGGGSSGSW